MASRVAVVFTVVLTLFVLSSFQAQARVQVEKPENLATEWNPSNDLPDSDAKSTVSILLPTDRIQSYSEEIPNDRSVETEPKDLPESDADGTTVRSMRPFTLSYDDGFRPINQHFHHMPLKHHQPFHFSFPIRCRHHQQLGNPMGRGRGRGMGMGMGPRFTYGREISYGNDMIMSEEAKFDPMTRFQQGEMRRIPGMMIPRRPDGDNNGFRDEDKMERHHHHHRHHHEEEHEREDEDEHDHKHKREHEHDHDHDHKHKREHEEREEREEEGGFMFLRNFRKFLNDMKP